MPLKCVIVAAHSKVILISTHSEKDLAHLIGSRALGFVPKRRLSAQAIRDLLDGEA